VVTAVCGPLSLQKRLARTGRGARVDDRRRADEEMAGSLNVCHIGSVGERRAANDHG